MSQRSLHVQSAGKDFHVYNRGVMRGQIFFSDWDYCRFIELMKISLIREQLSVHAFSLMPNHYHTIPAQHFPRAMSGCLKRACETYAQEFNK